MPLDNEVLNKAINNENNSSLIHYTNKKIKAIKNDYLQKLQLSREELKDYHDKLKNYRYVDDLSDILYGRYIRWVNLKNPDNLKLTKGGIIIEIKILENGIHVVCKNARNQRFQLKIDECLIFQKLTQQEQILLSALDYLHEK
tara:strand:- start:176 stop:604 length:429 start_codon:yes stop_codon:yes gene_type:complete